MRERYSGCWFYYKENLLLNSVRLKYQEIIDYTLDIFNNIFRVLPFKYYKSKKLFEDTIFIVIKNCPKDYLNEMTTFCYGLSTL